MRANALVCLKTDYEDNKMKKDTLATLHVNSNKYILSNLHINISNLLNYALFYEYLAEQDKGQSNETPYHGEKSAAGVLKRENDSFTASIPNLRPSPCLEGNLTVYSSAGNNCETDDITFFISF